MGGLLWHGQAGAASGGLPGKLPGAEAALAGQPPPRAAQRPGSSRPPVHAKRSTRSSLQQHPIQKLTATCACQKVIGLWGRVDVSGPAPQWCSHQGPESRPCVCLSCLRMSSHLHYIQSWASKTEGLRLETDTQGGGSWEEAPPSCRRGAACAPRQHLQTRAAAGRCAAPAAAQPHPARTAPAGWARPCLAAAGLPPGPCGTALMGPPAHGQELHRTESSCANSCRTSASDLWSGLKSFVRNRHYVSAGSACTWTKLSQLDGTNWWQSDIESTLSADATLVCVGCSVKDMLSINCCSG